MIVAWLQVLMAMALAFVGVFLGKVSQDTFIIVLAILSVTFMVAGTSARREGR